MLKFATAKCEELIGRMVVGDEEAILIGASSGVPILNLSSIVYGTKFRLYHAAFIEALREKLSVSSDTVFGVQVRSFAVASMDVLEVQPYIGEDETIRKIIDSRFQI